MFPITKRFDVNIFCSENASCSAKKNESAFACAFDRKPESGGLR